MTPTNAELADQLFNVADVLDEDGLPVDELTPQIREIAKALRAGDGERWISVEDATLESGQYYDVSFRTREGDLLVSSGAKWDGCDWWDEDGDCLRDYSF